MFAPGVCQLLWAPLQLPLPGALGVEDSHPYHKEVSRFVVRLSNLHVGSCPGFTSLTHLAVNLLYSMRHRANSVLSEWLTEFPSTIY